MFFCHNLYKADTWLKRTIFSGPVGVRFSQVLLYELNPTNYLDNFYASTYYWWRDRD